MIRRTLMAGLAKLGESSLEEPDLLRRVEQAADDLPADPTTRATLVALHGWLTRDQGLPPVIGGVARERLVRWDATSTTWTGLRVDGSGHGMVRVLRPHTARDPVLTRQFLREGRALKAAHPTLELHDSPPASMSLTLGGSSFVVGPRGGSATSHALARLLAGTTATLVTREQAGLGFLEPDDAEIIDVDSHLEWVCLTLTEQTDAAPVLTAIANALRRWWDPGEAHTVSEVLEALLAAPPRTMDDAADHVRQTLASVLASRRHALATAYRERNRLDRADALEDLVERLVAGAPPPPGRGAVGVDLEGNTLVVEARLGTISFGVDGEPLALVCDHDGTLDASLARRLVRTRAGAPISERLNREAGGDAAFAERITRWTAAALQLRTLRMLLHASRG